MKLITYHCPICGITETEYDAFANTFRAGLPLTCEGPTSFLDFPNLPKRSPHEMTEMVVVQD